MKYLFATKLRYFWIVLPMTGMLSAALILNKYAEGLLKLYPLIVFLSGCIIFTFVYLFRVVGLGYDEVRTIGLFSSREHVMINKDRTLVLTLMKKRRIKIELFGNDNILAQLDWLCANEDGSIPDINLFRTRAIGSKGSVIGILKFYGVPSKDAVALVNRGTEYEDTLVRAQSTFNEFGEKQILIFFKETFDSVDKQN